MKTKSELLDLVTLIQSKVQEKVIAVSSSKGKTEIGLYAGEVCPVGPCMRHFGHSGFHWEDDETNPMHSIKDVDKLFNELKEKIQNLGIQT